MRGETGAVFLPYQRMHMLSRRREEREFMVRLVCVIDIIVYLEILILKPCKNVNASRWKFPSFLLGKY
jgi:hypothetical protein